MFKAISKEVLIALYNQAITMCKDSNNSGIILLKLMGVYGYTQQFIQRNGER